MSDGWCRGRGGGGRAYQLYISAIPLMGWVGLGLVVIEYGLGWLGVGLGKGLRSGQVSHKIISCIMEMS